MQIRLASYLQSDSIVDGEGIRTVIWTQGCPHHCPGCHNPMTHDFKGGFSCDVEEIKNDLAKLEGQDGITLSGGDPMFQAEACAEIAKYAKSIGLNVWCYTGYLYEQLVNNSKAMELLKNVDVLVDGKFILEQRTLDGKFRGSKNQRVIDVQTSLRENKVCLVDKYASSEREGTMYQKSEFMFI